MDNMYTYFEYKESVKRLRNSGLYQKWKKEVYKKCFGQCVVCGSTQNLEYHHIYPFSSFPNERFNVDTGICLCKNHHNVGVYGSFHNTYGTSNNTPEQLEEYVNLKRQELGIYDYFDVYTYMNNIESDDLETDGFIAE